MDIATFVDDLYRVVVLGDPGAGKSTLANKIVADLSHGPATPASMTPILVILREYALRKQEAGCSLLEFIEFQANTRYQVGTPPTGAFGFMLDGGQSLVVFDGLDELLQASVRIEVMQDVASFASRYPHTPILVTSRRVGYEEAPLPSDVFAVFHLDDFDEPRITEYVEKWFALDETLDLHERQRFGSALLRESADIADLRSNPLMLSLLCALYRGEQHIPRNRADVYERCATLLFEQWDGHRGIKYEVPFRDHLRPALMHLGFWIYSNESLQAGVTEFQLIQETVNYLVPRRYEDDVQARAAAHDFIAFCRGRAWVLTDTGSTASGEPLYQFTHRTFLEYFAAAQLAHSKETASGLWETLAPHVRRTEWEVVAQMAIQLKARLAPDRGDAVLAALLHEAAIDHSARSALLSFAGRALQGLVPAPATVRAVAKAIVLATTEMAESDRMANGVTETYLQSDLVRTLNNAAPENRPILVDQIAAAALAHAATRRPNASALLDLILAMGVLRRERS